MPTSCAYLKKLSWVFIAGLFVVSFPSLLMAQTSAGFPTPTKQAISDVAAYDGLIHLAAAMDKKAKELDSKSIGHGLRNGMIKSFGLTADELPIFLDDCHKAHDKIEQLDRKANQIITKFRETLSDSKIQSQPPAPPPELLTLQQNKIEAIYEAMSQFDAHLSQTSRNNIAMHLKSLVGDREIIATKKHD
jgi:hypothetical protein